MNKVWSMLLAFVMVLGLVPISAMAADTPAGEVYYEKVTDPEYADAGVYLLVAEGKAVTHKPGLKNVSDSGGRISGDHSDAEWNVTPTGSGFRFENGGRYLKITESSWNVKVGVSSGEASFEAIEKNGGMILEMNSRFLRIKDGKLTGSGYYNTPFTLYQKVDSTVPGPEPENPDPVVTFVPEIQWERTQEYNYRTHDKGDLVVGQPFLSADKQEIVWEWDNVKDLTTDPNMTVWDYKTRDQYAPDPNNGMIVPNQDQVKAATWINRDSRGDVVSGDAEQASFRRFAGTFVWPEGYDLEDTATIASVNDRYYQPIYDYINHDSELRARFAGQKVIPINDDMYVYVYKDSDKHPSEWTAEEAERHLVFWSGTDGQGRWSAPNARYKERRTPLTYLDKAAVPAYWRNYPNNYDTDPRAGGLDERDFDPLGPDVPMEQSDGWYTLVNTNALMSTLNKL